MKMNKVILGLAAAAMGLASANVMAQTTLADYNANPAGFLNVFASGASAQDQGIERWFRLQCTNNSLHIYRITGNGNQRLFLCNVTSATVPGFPAGGQRVAFFKSSVGGSGNGVQPVADQTLLAFLDPANVSGCNSPAATAAAPPFGAFFDHTCTTSGTLQNRVSDAGISDVEPRLFGATPAQVQRLTVSSQNAVIWGVPVTTALRNAIQDAQGSVVGGDRESKESMPTLSRQQVTSLYVGQLVDWNDFTHPTTGVGMATSAAQTDASVYLCRRVSTSGTQASYEVNFLRQRCISGAPAMPAGNGTTVIEGSGTSNVISCLSNHNAAGRWAVGLFSTENQEFTSGGVDNGFRFVKVDGHAPTLLAVVMGGYPYFSEQTIQWRVPGFNPPTGLKLSLLNNFRTEMGNPNIIRDLNLGFNHSWGQSGLLALTTNGHTPPPTPYTAANTTATPVSAQSKSYLGTTNNCLEPALTAAQNVGGS